MYVSKECESKWSAFKELDLLRKSGTVTDDVTELESYRNEKYSK